MISIDWPVFLGWTIGIIVAAFLLVWGIKRLIWRLRAREIHGLDRKEIKRKWQEIEKFLDQNNEMAAKVAIIEADKLFDHVLRFAYFPGDDMGQRLKAASLTYPEIKAVWWAHLLRNRLVHETNARISIGEAKKALGLFEKGLKQLGML